MGFLRSKDKTPVVEQRDFIRTSDELIGKATDGSTSVKDSVEAAKKVTATLVAIDTGKLKVQPPLSNEQFLSYQTQANMIESLGAKALGAIEESERLRQQQPASQPESPQAPAYQGAGGSAKS